MQKINKNVEPEGTIADITFCKSQDRYFVWKKGDVPATRIANDRAFVPINVIAAPEGTTHFKVISGGTEVDFTNGTFVTDTKESDILSLDGESNGNDQPGEFCYCGKYLVFVHCIEIILFLISCNLG